MENAADALKMAFAVFVFIVALSITFYLLTATKETADSILWYADKENYIDKTDGSKTREVGVDAVISTLKNRGDQSSYVTVIEPGFNVTFKITEADDARVEDFIKTHVDKDYTYTETIREIVTSGVYYIGEDNTRVYVAQGGSTRRYIIYQKK